jgi:hypothetical protein
LVFTIIIDGFVKSSTSALCCISQSFNVRKVRLMITKFARLEFELFTKPSKSDFLRVHYYSLTVESNNVESNVSKVKDVVSTKSAPPR